MIEYITLRINQLGGLSLNVVITQYAETYSHLYRIQPKGDSGRLDKSTTKIQGDRLKYRTPITDIKYILKETHKIDGKIKRQAKIRTIILQWGE